MSTPESSRLRTQYVPTNADAPSEAAHARDPLGFIATLDRIGKGAAADGQPWPERHQMPGRRMALADADCALTGLRVALEMLLAAERVRQNGPDEEYVGDRVMEGLMMVSLSLTAQVSARMRPEG
ncbi:hypothetical protein [Stenotrophomonas maltophilia]|uniref:hypothetical protein n=1 Tax=Stenotrophomonas maltophilia TaxID=40324 RepID=UPI000C15753E|nr:hypothetical protein [Stenotrophomonas maltophilia]MCI1059692.1 hypothetical protein [Stenotrophomonas maltophilia]MCI1061749.1 hypothetical protein [Stenotrophomonas maltophilia]MCI1080490.1 hypothetical protein [Stenotrophomonas maltophilia]MCI1082579.1 hypothetical protein [Stenotrophomonas maltophilia]MCI1096791.1 hypothetical protein [Stenotrophomonas maltophilia]